MGEETRTHACGRTTVAGGALSLAFIVFLALLITQPAALANLSDGIDGAGSLQIDIPNELMPRDMGQTDRTVFVPETGHTVMGTMLEYWRASGAGSAYGNPVPEPYPAPNGYYSQAFERGIFRYLPEVIWTDDPTVRLQPIGASEFETNREVTRADGRRIAGDRRAERTVPAPNQSLTRERGRQ